MVIVAVINCAKEKKIRNSN